MYLGAALRTRAIDIDLVLELKLWHWQDIVFPSDPYVERGEQEDIDGESPD